MKHEWQGLITIEAGTLRVSKVFSTVLCMLGSFHIKYYRQAVRVIINNKCLLPKTQYKACDSHNPEKWSHQPYFKKAGKWDSVNRSKTKKKRRRSKTTFKFRCEYKGQFFMVEGHRANTESEVKEMRLEVKRNLQSYYCLRTL